MISRRLLTLSALTALLGAVAAALALFAFDQFDDDDEVGNAAVSEPSPTPEATEEPTPEPTPDPTARFARTFAPVGCELTEFSAKLNEWTVGAQQRAERLEVLGGIGFWREILSGIPPVVERLPARHGELKTAALDYIGALDAYLAKLSEYWFTAQEGLNGEATNQLLFADEQRALLQATAEEAAGGPFTLDCPA